MTEQEWKDKLAQKVALTEEQQGGKVVCKDGVCTTPQGRKPKADRSGVSSAAVRPPAEAAASVGLSPVGYALGGAAVGAVGAALAGFGGVYMGGGAVLGALLGYGLGASQEG